MNTKEKISVLDFIKSFFPFQLLVGHLKHNLIVIFYWLILFLIVTDNLGSSFGIPYLFFSPEYLGDVNSIAFFLIGFSIGGFTMGFNTFSYTKLGTYYPFLLVVKKPFLKFCVNNSIIPLLFISVFISEFSAFQAKEEFASTLQITLFILSFLGGIFLFMLLSLLYFFPKKQSPISAIHSSNDEDISNKKHSILNKSVKWYDFVKRSAEKRYIYIGKNLKLFNSRSIKHLDKNLRERIFNSNKVNTSLFEVITITTFISVGLFSKYAVFEIPAAMSVVLLLTVILMLFSALLSWLRKWTYPILFVLIFLMDHFSLTTNMFTYKNYAYGLTYDKEEKSIYSVDKIKDIEPFEEEKSKKKILANIRRMEKKYGNR